MANAVATVEETPAAPKGTSLIVQIGLLVALSVLAAGIGWLAGNALDTSGGTQKSGHDADQASASGEPALRPDLVMLDGITTNLAAPASIWVRLDLGLVFEGPPDAATTDAVHQDLLAYLRTVKLHQIEGASGFQHFRSDLRERAAIRSEGKVTDIVIRTLLFE